MCEQSEVQYLDGDVVWVKLGPCWWPGEVCDAAKLPPEITQSLKKQPIAIVKFFQEDTYEYVKNLNQIYKYNCRKKNEFIKKGLDMHRAKVTFMDKFPADVCHAETLTGGDPDIITSDIFAPEQKPSYAAIFGTPSPKKSPKLPAGRGRPSLGTPRPASSLMTPPQKRITHPRFVGKSDHEVRILEQSTPSPQSSHYTCHICGFESTRLNVIVLHNKGHSNGTYVSPPKPKSRASTGSASPKKGKKPKSFASTRSIDEDLELIRQGLTLSPGDSSYSDSEPEDGKKSYKRKHSKTISHPNKKPKVSNICNILQADWGDSDSNEETPVVVEKPVTDSAAAPTDPAPAPDKGVANNNVHSELLADWEDKNSDDQSASAESPPHKDDKDKKLDEKSSCFDFKDEDDSEVIEKSPGRKIPRVIPPKRLSLDIDVKAKRDTSRRNTTESASEQHMDTCDNSTDFNKHEINLQSFENILKTTTVPDVPDLPSLSDAKVPASSPKKSKSKKQDDEKTNGALRNSDRGQSSSDAESAAADSVAPQLPKKRIVRSFEEFEILLNEQKQAEEESARTKSTLEVSKLKSQLMSKLTDTPPKQEHESVVLESKEKSTSKMEREEAQEESVRADSEESLNEMESVEDKSETICSEEITNDEALKKSSDAESPEEKANEISDDVMTEDSITEPVKKDTESSQSTFESEEDDTVELPEKMETTANVEEAVAETQPELAADPIRDPTDQETLQPDKTNEEPVMEQESRNEEISEEVVEMTETEKVELHVPAADEELEQGEKMAASVEAVPSECAETIPETMETVGDSTTELPSNLPLTQTETEVMDSEPEPSSTQILSNEEDHKESVCSSKKETVELTKDTTDITNDFEQSEETEESVLPDKEAVLETKEPDEVIEQKTEEAEIAELPEKDVTNDVCKMDVEEQNHSEASIAEERSITEELTPVQDTEDTRSQKMLVDISDICIDNTDNLSGLSTLAAVSELTGNRYEKTEMVTEEPVEDSKKEEELPTTSADIVEEAAPISSSPEEREVTEEVVASEEVPATVSEEASVSTEPTETIPHKPVATLANFSMDFSDSNSESAIIKEEHAEEANILVTKSPEPTEEASNVPNKDKVKPEIADAKREKELNVNDVPTDFESIESEIEKITSMETNSDKLNSFPENISHHGTECDIVDAPEIAYQDYGMTETTKSTVAPADEFVPKVEDTSATGGHEATLESEIAKLTDTQPGPEEVLHEQQQNTSSSKLLEILTDSKTGAAASASSDTIAEAATHVAKTVITSGTSQKVHMVITGDSSSISKKFDPKTSKFVIKSAISKTQSSSKSNKPIILSEKIIKPVTETENVSVKKVTSKRSYQDVEDIDTFIIQKPSKKPNTLDSDQQDIILTPKAEVKSFKAGARVRGKPKIIEQTIIKAADVPQSSMSGESQPLLDDAMFDINSMPIVLSDQILTPESIENMPVVMTELMPSSAAGTAQLVTTTAASSHSVAADKAAAAQTIAVKRGGAIQQVKLINKTKSSTSQAESQTAKLNQSAVKTIMQRGLSKNQKVYQTSSSKLLKSNTAVITQPGKPGKFIILPSTTASPTGSKYTVGKRLSTIKNIPAPSSSAAGSPASKLKSIQNVSSEPTGNKIMIVTNQQGVQSRLLLTPAQQKMLGCKMPTTKITKSPSAQQKSSVLQKSILTSKGTILASVNSPGIMTQKSTLASQTIITSKNQLFTTSSGQALVTSEGQVLTPITQQQMKSLKPDAQKLGKKVQVHQSRVLLSDKVGEAQKGKVSLGTAKTKTILIKGSQGHTLKKLQTSVGDSKTMVVAQSSHKSGGGHLMSLTQSGLSGKQVVIATKSPSAKVDMKAALSKQMSDKAPKPQPSKQTVSSTSRLLQKASARTPMILSSAGSTAASKQLALGSGGGGVPPLAPITAAQTKKADAALSHKQAESKLATALDKDKAAEASALVADSAGRADQKPPNQLIIQDAMGNQTTVTEGQILALPSGETVDGQPQSYVLVTVDESGNLVPISNDTLMSLDPSLGLGGDMNNIVLQIDQTGQEQPAEAKAEPVAADTHTFPTNAQSVIDTNEQQQLLTMDNQQLILSDQNLLSAATTTEPQAVAATESQQMYVDKERAETFASADSAQAVPASSEAAVLMQDTQTVACSIGSGESGQQLIITGDPESTQKFLASLSEGNTDLSSLLSGTDGNIIINTDGQQILLNADSDNQILLSVNSDGIGLIQPSTEGDSTQNALYVTQQAMKNQDILAAALADTDVFQQEQAGEKAAAGAGVTAGTTPALTKVSSSAQSQLSPNSSLYPMNVGNVLETSLTLGSPIMTPLEVPSVNNKKITNTDIESALITQVPSSLELPITITDPSISQTVSQQVMLGNDLQSNLELPITLSDPGISSIRSSEMSSPSFVYSLPTLDEGADLEQKRAFPESTTAAAAAITTDSIYNTALTGSMSMPLLTEEPEIAVVAEQSSTNVEDAAEAAPAEATVSEAASGAETSQRTSYSAMNTDNIQTSISDKMTTELQIGPIEEELDLNATDICSSLSEPPPGMFDKSSFSLDSAYLTNKDREEPLEADSAPADPPAASAADDTAPIAMPALSDSAVAEARPASPSAVTPPPASAPAPADTGDVPAKGASECALDLEYNVPESCEPQPGGPEPAAAQDMPHSDLSETPNSDLNSPRLDIDENSTEIPIQPTIITNLSDNFDENNTSPEYSAHKENKKRPPHEEADDENDVKKRKVSDD